MIVFVCALFCEAKPLIDHFHLKIVSNELPFPIYERQQIQLIITGIGKVHAAMGCSFLAGKYSHQHTAWFNVGVCGALKEIGTPFLAHKITDGEKSYYPSFVFPLPCESLSLETFDTPQVTLKDNLLHDMEGAGFFAACSRFSTVELIHCLKIVSDHGAGKLEKEKISNLIQKQLPLIETYSNLLLSHVPTNLC